jgi:SAM-dependent methyltransferase
VRLDNPLVVRWEYASEERLAIRNAIYRELIQGVDAEQVVFDAIREAAPRRVLDAGCGPGDMAERVARELGAEVIAIDISPRMVALTAARGIDARLSDVQNLEFADGEFDLVISGWVLYHATDLEKALREIVRVLRPGGRLVASTMGMTNLRELWELVGAADRRDPHSFHCDNGEEILARHFASVEERPAVGTVVFPNAGAARRFVAATITRAHLAAHVPDFEQPLAATSVHSVFVAQKSP